MLPCTMWREEEKNRAIIGSEEKNNGLDDDCLGVEVCENGYSYI